MLLLLTVKLLKSKRQKTNRQKQNPKHPMLLNECSFCEDIFVYILEFEFKENLVNDLISHKKLRLNTKYIEPVMLSSYSHHPIKLRTYSISPRRKLLFCNQQNILEENRITHNNDVVLVMLIHFLKAWWIKKSTKYGFHELLCVLGLIHGIRLNSNDI